MSARKFFIICVLAAICLVGIGGVSHYLNRIAAVNKVDQDSNESIVFEKEQNGLSLHDARFVVIYSDAMKEGAELVTYRSNGEILNIHQLNKGRALYYTVEVDGDYFITSERQNHHFQLKKSGDIVSFYGPAIYDKDRAIGSSFVRCSNNYLFFTMNMGFHPKYSPEQYSNELVYWDYKKNTYHHMKLPGYFQSVVESDNKAYVLYVDGPVNTVGIYVIDLISNQLLHDYPIHNHNSKQNDEEYYPTGQFNGSSLQLFQNRLVVLMDGNRPDTQAKPIIQVINPLNGTLEKEIKVSKEMFFLYSSIIHDGQIYLVSNENQVVVLDQKFQIHDPIQLEQKAEFVQKRNAERGYMSGTQIVGNSIYVLYDFVKNTSSERAREIHKYNLKTGKEEAVIPLSYQSDKEMVRFFVLPLSRT